MKKALLFCCISALSCTAYSQQNYLDNYLTGAVTYSVVADGWMQISMPRDLDFKPNTNELWIANKGTNGGERIIIHNAGLPNQSSEKRKDSHADHFDNTTSAIAFADNVGEYGSTGEYKQGTGTFQGPSLWSSDLEIYAKVFQNNWVTGYPLGSHNSMLHQSPYSMGIAHDNNEVFWVFDGYNGNICKYDYVNDHSPGYDDHSAGKIWRYTGVTVTRVPNVPSHMVKDKSSGWLYFIDGGSKRLRRLNTNTGSVVGNLSTPSTGAEALSGYYNMGSTATVETIETFATQPCGIDYYNNRLIVSDYTNGNITIYNTSTTTPTKLGTIATGQTSIMGVKVGPDGKIWFVNYAANTVVRMEPASASADDASIRNITAPVLVNFEPHFHSPKFNDCIASTISPKVLLHNNGSNTLTAVTINYKIDFGAVSSFSWTGSLTSGDTVSVSLTPIPVFAGTHKLTAYTSSPNGNTDPNPANDTKEGSFRAITTSNFPFSEGFSSSVFPPVGWDVMGFNRYAFLSRSSTVGGFGTNTGSAKMTYKITLTENHSGQVDYLMMPRIDLTTAPSTGTVMEFSVAYAQRTSSTNDNLKVQASIDCGNTWTTIYTKSGATLATAAVTSAAFTPSASQWRKESINLTAYVGQPVMLMFVTTSGNGNNIYIDDVKVTNPSVGVPENDISATISVYPNPATDKVVISSTSTLFNNSTISLYSILGEEIMKTDKINSNWTELDLSGYTNGIYFLNINTDSGKAVKKIVISK